MHETRGYLGYCTLGQGNDDWRNDGSSQIKGKRLPDCSCSAVLAALVGRNEEKGYAE
jgi:hypothetical protein